MYSYCIKTNSQNFSLDILHPQFQDDDIIINSDEIEQISHSKNQIDKYRFNKQWERIKKVSNPYELVYVNDKMISQKSVANIEPISRSFFKMLEITYIFLEELVISQKKYETCELPSSIKPIRTLSLCESPGGFIASIRHIRNYHPLDELFGISLKPNNKNVPSWTKSNVFFNSNPQIKILYGVDNTGDIYNPANIIQLTRDLGGYYTCDLITGDGGFDFSIEFNNQEKNMSKLIYCQILAALINQKAGGSFVLKIFDCFYKATVDMIFLLTMFYDNVSIVKPCTSRLANSEKYIVCTNFRFNNSNVYFDYFAKALEKCCQPNIFFTSVLQNIRPPLYFYSKLEEINLIFGKSQIENIFNTLSLIDNKFKTDKIDFLIKSNKTKCSNWCIKNRVSYFIPETENPFVRKIKDDNKDESKNV